MSELALGAFAGGAVLAALPLGRLFNQRVARRRLLMGTAVGILLLLFADLAGHMIERPVELITAARAGTGALSPALIMLAMVAAGLLFGGIGAGLIGRSGAGGGLAQAGRLALLTAAAVGGYNLLQGMAIGQAGRFTAHTAVSEGEGTALLLAGLLIQNGVKGFAILAPLFGSGLPLSRRFLLTLLLIAGLPALLGTALGVAIWSPNLFVGLFAAALALTGSAIWRLVDGARPLNARFLAVIAAGFVLAVIGTFALEISQYSLPELLSTYRLAE